MRELSRTTARVLKRVREESRPVIVTFRGQPVALLSPVAAANGLVALLDKQQPGGDVDKKEIVDALEGVTDIEKRILDAFPPGTGRSSIAQIAARSGLDHYEVFKALGRLEMRGLVTKTFYGYVRA